MAGSSFSIAAVFVWLASEPIDRLLHDADENAKRVRCRSMLTMENLGDIIFMVDTVKSLISDREFEIEQLAHYVDVGR